MSCGCPSNDSSTPRKEFDRVSIAQQVCPEPPADSCTTKGLLYDKLLEQFIMTSVGGEANMTICESSRWEVGQFLAANLPNNQIAVFKITSKPASNKIKVLNGCTKGAGAIPILGNPSPGYVIPVNSVIYAIPPTGCDSDFANKVIQAVEAYGAEAVRNILAEEDSICFTNVPEMSEDDNELHVFGGTTADCECAPDVQTSSCLRKLLNIITGYVGKTFCFKEIPVVDFSTVEGAKKRLAMIMPGTNCLVAGPEVGDTGSGEGGDPFAKPKNYATIVFSSSSANGGQATSGGWLTRPLNNVPHRSSTDFVVLSGNVITILKPGKYSINWSCEFYNTQMSQSRLINNFDSSEVYHGSPVRSYGPLLQNVSTANSTGSIILEVETTKAIKMEYRVQETVSTRGLGNKPDWTSNCVFAHVSIIEI